MEAVLTPSLILNFLQGILLVLLIGLVLRWFISDVQRSHQGNRQEAREIRDEKRDDAADLRQLARDQRDGYTYPISEEDPETLARKGFR